MGKDLVAILGGENGGHAVARAYESLNQERLSI